MSNGLTIDQDGDWVPLEETDDRPRYRVRVEVSKSGRANCRFCSEAIQKDALRIGIPIKWRGWITSWRHLKCYYVDDGYGPVPFEECYGASEIEGNDRKLLEDALGRMKPPIVDESLDPENPEFVKAKQLEQFPTPEGMTTSLLPFQGEALGWLLEQEDGEFGGGLLCDEMGMGKTIQTISLIVASKNKHGFQGPTLVVSPSSSMMQWMEEIRNTTEEEKLKVLLYHGSKRGMLTPGDIMNHDVVLTSYPILEYEYRQCLDRMKVPCKYCNKKYLPRKLIVHNRYFCGPDSKRTAKLALRQKKEEAEKKQETMKKAMKTLAIGQNKRHTLPTPSNIYQQYMQKANREPVSMYTSADKAREIMKSSSSAAAASDEKNVEHIDNEDEDSDDDDVEFLELDDKEPNRPKKQREKGVEAKPKELTVRNLWVLDKGKAFVFKSTKSLWISNFVKDGRCMTFSVGKNSKAPEDMILISKDDKTVKLKIASTGAAFLSVNSGKTWYDFVSKEQGTWIDNTPSTIDKDWEEGWKVEGPSIGDIVIRGFDDSDVLAVVVAYAPEEGPNEELFHVRHVDGDTEDLDKRELKQAVKLKKSFIGNLTDNDVQIDLPEAHVRHALVKRIRGIHESLNSAQTVVVKSASTHKKQKKKKKTKKEKDSKPAKKKQKTEKTKKDNDDDSDFVANSSSSSSEDEQDDDMEGDSNDEEEVVTTTIKPLKPKFLPATWGPGSDDAKMFAKWKGLVNAKKGKKRRKQQKKSRKKKAKMEKENSKKLGGKGDDKESDIESSEEEDDDDEEEEEEEEEHEEEHDTSRWEDNTFWYAPKGNVVDDDGVDMGSSLLHSIGWNRIVLDEAHKIKDRVNSTAKSTLALRGAPTIIKKENESVKKGTKPSSSSSVSSKKENVEETVDPDWPDGGPCHRWCLTGTPLQNRVGELYSLVRFLRIEPFAYYFCKAPGCECKSLHWAMGNQAKVCEACGHTPMRHYSYFNQRIINPIKRNGHVGAGMIAMKVLRDELLGKLMLRRTKQERQNDIKLPPMQVTVEKLEFTEQEQDFYESIYMHTRARFDTYVEKGTLLHNYAHIFELLSRLRRAADHPYLVCHGASDDILDQKNAAEQVAQNRKKHRADVCGICHFEIQTLEECALSSCRHTFHKKCLDEYLDKEDEEVEDDEDAVLEGNGKKPKTKKGKKTPKKKKGGKKNLDEELPNCPVCYVPMSVTLNMRGGTEKGADPMDADAGDDLCVVCMDQKRDALLLPCAHIYLCMGCAKKLDNKTCPMCRTEITKITRVDPNVGSASAEESVMNGSKKSAALVGRKSILQRINLRNFSSSTKTNAVCAAVKKMMAEDVKEQGMPNKAIIFSQYTDMLDLIEWSLKNDGIKTVKLVGSLNITERQAVLSAFKTDPSVSVILMSLKAGGEGLNLQEASHVFITDVWWNFAVESQALQRAHRIGQKRAVTAIRFVTNGSIEEKMLELQQKKLLAFQGTVDGSQAALDKLSKDDLCFLFSR